MKYYKGRCYTNINILMLYFLKCTEEIILLMKNPEVFTKRFISLYMDLIVNTNKTRIVVFQNELIMR